MSALHRTKLIQRFLIVAGVSVVSLGLYRGVARAEIYVVEGRRGSITFTSRQPSNGIYRVIRRTTPRFSRFHSSRGRKLRPRISDFDNVIYSTADEHSIDRALVKAVVHVESSFNPDATSYKGAMGLMQLMPQTASRFRVSDPYRPEENVRGGVEYLRWLLDRYEGNLTLAVAAYNAGEGAVDRYRGIPPYRETQEYVRRVLQTTEAYRCVHAGRKDCAT